MKTVLKEMDVSASVEVTVGNDYRPIKVRSFASKKMTVEMEPTDDNTTVMNAKLAEQRRLFRVCWQSVHEQIQNAPGADQINTPT